jgi:hypothetical protein
MSADTGKELFRLGFLTAIEVPDRGYVGGLLVTNHFGRPLEFQCTAPIKPNRTQEILYGPTLVPYVLGDLIGRTLIEKVGVKPHLVLTERQDLLGLRELVEIPVACVDDLTETEKAAATQSAELPDSEAKGDKPAALVATNEPVAITEPSSDGPAHEVAAAEEQSTLEATIPEPALNPSEADPERVSSEIAPVEASKANAQRESSPTDAAEPKRLSQDSRADLQEADGSAIQLGRQLLRFHAAHAADRSVASRGARVVPNHADLREPFERVREALGESARLGGTR